MCHHSAVSGDFLVAAGDGAGGGTFERIDLVLGNGKDGGVEWQWHVRRCLRRRAAATMLPGVFGVLEAHCRRRTSAEQRAVQAWLQRCGRLTVVVTSCNGSPHLQWQRTAVRGGPVLAMESLATLIGCGRRRVEGRGFLTRTMEHI